MNGISRGLHIQIFISLRFLIIVLMVYRYYKIDNLICRTCLVFGIGVQVNKPTIRKTSVSVVH